MFYINTTHNNSGVVHIFSRCLVETIHHELNKNIIFILNQLSTLMYHVCVKKLCVELVGSIVQKKDINSGKKSN